VDLTDWWKLGFVTTVLNLFIWLAIGGLWWKVLGIL